MTLWLLGYPDRALEAIGHTLALTQEVWHPHEHVIALSHAAMLHQFRGEGQTVRERAAAAVRLATAQGFSFWVAHGTILEGWALAMQGQAEGLAQMEQGLAAWRAIGQQQGRPYMLSLLAEGYAHGGRAAEGLCVVADALALAHTQGLHVWEAELVRLQGELLLMGASAQATEAEARFREALEVARRQRAKAFELRAALSLSRVWQRQGKRAKARKLLAPLYGWFTEGLNTADLQAAKALLGELS